MRKLFKRAISVLLVAVMVFSAAPLAGFVGLELPEIKELFTINAKADQFEGGYSYVGNSSGIIITGADSLLSGDVIVPSTFEGYPVISIGPSAFENCYSITSLTLPDTLTRIEENAFKSCLSLSSINIPDNVVRIEDYAFHMCGNLTDVSITNNSKLEYIGESAFSNCGIKSVFIPASVKSILWDAFINCDQLATVTFSGKINLDIIFSKTFYDCDALTEITIPASVVSIGGEAFKHCGALKSVTFENESKLESIDDSTFVSCDISSLKIPSSVKSIGDDAFNSNNNLATVIFENGSKLETIGDSAFAHCDGITSISIPEMVSSIGNGAFSYCEGLKYVHISSGVNLIGELVLQNSNAYICSDSENCYAKEYAEANRYEFRLCDGSHSIKGGEETPIVDKLLLESTYPVNNTTSVSYDDELVLTFNQNLRKNLYIIDTESAIKVCDYNTDAVIYSIDYDDYGVIGFRDSPVVIEGNILTIRNALHKLVPGSKYYVTISPNIILSQPDSDGNRKAFAGITDKDTWTFSYLSPSVKERYSLDVYFNEPTVSLSAGESASVSAVLSFNGATTFPEMAFSIDDTNVAEITEIKTESNITYATIKGKKQGSTTITVTVNTIDGNIVKKFPVFVSDPDTVYYCNYIDGRFDEYNPVEVSGMYIDDFKHTENDDGSVTASFTVYNHEHCYGTVDIYDENGSLVDYEVIDMYTGEYQTDIFSHIGYTCKLAEGMVTGEMFDPDVYKSEVWCKKTEISIVVPQNGFYVISNNISTSKACLAYNISTLLVEMLLKSNNFIDKLTDILSKKDLLSISANSEKIAKAFSEEFLNELIKKGSDKVTEDLIEALIEFSVESQAKSAAGVEKVFDSFEDCLNELGMDVFKTIKKSIVDVLKTSIIETALNVLFELSLKKCGKDFVDLFYYAPVTVNKWLATADSIQKHTDSTSVYIYNQQNNSMRKSNGIVSYTTENYNTVFHTVILKSGDKVDYVNRLTGEQEKAKVYDISLIRDGESVQPKYSVTVYIPIPNGWNVDNLTLYHISKETGKRESIPVEIENGYAKFVTDSFSYFILSTNELKFIDNLCIKTPSTTSINYGDTLILHADIQSIPNGTSIVWETSSDGVSIKVSDDGLSCAVTSAKTNTVSVSVKLVDDNGDIVTNFDGEELTASQIIKSKAGFFQKIIAFFKKLFGLTRIIPEAFRTVIR